MNSTAMPRPVASPSKGSSGRTYDSKLVTREMHRLGSLNYKSNTPGPSTSSLALPTTSGTSSTENPWGSLHIHVLPLFNGEPLRVPVEDLNVLVKQHIQGIVIAAPLKAMSTLEHDASDLVSSGMVTLNAKLSGIEDEKLVSRVVEIWGFFWDRILPYLEGVLLPLHTDSALVSLHRVPKSHRGSDASTKSPTLRRIPSSNLLSASPAQIDVRTIAIRAFRDQIVLPIFSRLYGCLTMLPTQDSFCMVNSTYQQPRLQQMLLVLASQGRRCPVAVSLTAPPPPPSAGESAIQHLLRALRTPLGEATNSPSPLTPRTSSFFFGAQPRDRRGRIGHKPAHLDTAAAHDGWDDNEEGLGAQTPTVRGGVGRILERELLDGLRSPDVDANRESTGGWGLGDWRDEVDDGASSHDEEDCEQG